MVGNTSNSHQVCLPGFYQNSIRKYDFQSPGGFAVAHTFISVQTRNIINRKDYQWKFIFLDLKERVPVPMVWSMECR
ncbi:hypothetical protein F3157_10560 [Virgibacillus dakarensis]|nr:hypothetical protein [Virgibacillus dakarensis]